MGRNMRRLAIGIGSSAAAASLILGQAAMASAATTSAARPAVTAPFDCTAAYVPPADGTPLTLGGTGADVLLLQNRLNCLHYWVGPINGKFGWDTLFAVWAFKEVQAGTIVPPNPNVVNAATQTLLTAPIHPLPPVTTPGGGATRIEVNKNLQILVLYKSGKVFLITHVSTARQHRSDGNYWFTPDGTYHALRWLKGKWVGSRGPFWNPVVYTANGKYMIHGDLTPTSLSSTSKYGMYGENVVALTPASHGCVRIPMDLSVYFHTYLKVAPGTAGTPIYITGPKYQY